MSLLQMSFSGAVMILVVIVIRTLAINKLPKKTFLALWGLVLLRLLVPFSLYSMFSAYSLIGVNTPVIETLKDTPASNLIPIVSEEQMTTVPNLESNTGTGRSVSAGAFIWSVGVFVCTSFFAMSYRKCRREFQTSLPVDNRFAKSWLDSHRLKRLISIRQSSRISAPLTYGIIRPVILVPKSTDWENTKALQYVFAHEYIHIRRFDAMIKLILIAALCIHWFNPLVWALYILANRDIELSCDEAVVRLFGENTKSTYARTLINMEAEKSGLTPLCNNFSKNAIEERITSIMKLKKTSVAAILAAVALVASVATAFATSTADSKNQLTAIPGTVFTDEDYEKLFALQYEGYEDMSVAQYRDRVLHDTDTDESINLLERFWQDETVYGLRDTNETAGFLCYVLVPLHAEKWLSRDYDGYAKVDYLGSQASLEYWFNLTILDGDALTVREYNHARKGFVEALQAFLSSKTPEELHDADTMEAACALEVDRLTKSFSSDKLKITAEYFFSPLEYVDPEAEEQASDGQEVELRIYPYGTQEDYESLLALKTQNYQQMPVTDFNNAVLNWANEDFDRSQRIAEDTGRSDYKVRLSEEELSFAALTISLSSEENHQMIKSDYTGKPEEDPQWNGPSLYKDSNGSSLAWCSLWYQYSYHISQKEHLTVGVRDRCIGGFINEVKTFWDTADLEELLLMTEEDIVSYLQEAALNYSNELLTISVNEDTVQFEHIDEWNIKPELQN